MSYVFSFDARACSGCKACQAACKDRNNLPEGVLWRRVIEVSGGDWIPSGPAWINTVFAYNFSLACNHCIHPKCAGVCPTNAYHVRDDGIVLLDSTKCIGCGYCNWACPYAVPQYNSNSGLMSKCNFCCDAIDKDEPPACVVACPLRVLNYFQIHDDEQENNGMSLWETSGFQHPFPLPAYSRTQPHIQLNPHPAMLNNMEKKVANREEIKSGNPKSELPLVFFTLLGQMAVGGFWVLQWMFTFLWTLVGPKNENLRLIPAVMIGACLALAALSSFLHLGRKRNAWMSLGNLGKSWLSREILFFGLFSTSWLFWLFLPSSWLGWVTSLLGLALIYSMANVYRLRSMAVWNTWRTLAAFLVSALLLGQFLFMPVVLVEAKFVGIELLPILMSCLFCLSGLLLACEVILDFSNPYKKASLVGRMRVGLILMTMAGLVGGLLSNQNWQPVIVVLFFLLLFIEECIGRLQFYTELELRVL